MTEPWTSATLSDLAEVNPDKASAVRGLERFRYIDISLLSERGVSEASSIPIVEATEAPSRAQRLVKAGDSLVSTVRPERGARGLVSSELDGQVASSGICVLRPRLASDAGFVYALVRGLAFTEWCINHSTGTAYPAVAAEAIARFPVLLPPSGERQRIAEVLSALDSRINSCVDLTRGCEALVLAHFDLMQESAASWAGSVMREATMFVGGSTPSTSVAEYWDPPAHRWSTPRDLSRLEVPVVVDSERRVSDLGRDQISSRLLPAGSVLLSSRAPIGYLAWLAKPSGINQGIIGFLPGGLLSPTYMYAWCKRSMDEIEGRAGGTTFAEISKTNFGSMPVLVPDEVSRSRFDELTSSIVATMVQLSGEIVALHKLRDFLLPRLVSGELRVAEAEELAEAAT